MKICRFTGEDFPPLEKISEGLAPNYYYLSKELERLGVKTIFITGGYPKYKKSEQSNYIYQLHRTRTYPKILRTFAAPLSNMQAYKIIKKYYEEIDVLQCHNWHGYWLQKHKFKFPVVVTSHGDDLDFIKSKFEPLPLRYGPRSLLSQYEVNASYYLNKSVCKNADHIVAVCNSIRDNIHKYYKIPFNKISVIHNGANIKNFKPLKLKKENIFSILYVGSLSTRKGLKYLFKSLYDLNFPFKLQIIGGGKDAERRYTNDLLRKYGLQDKVNIKKVHHIELSAFYSSADLFVFPTLTEGLPKVVVEALACECPVIATNVSGNPEVIEQEKTGILVPPKDSTALRNAIIWALQNQSEMKKMARAGRKKVLKKFTWEIAAKKYADVYESLLRR